MDKVAKTIKINDQEFNILTDDGTVINIGETYDADMTALFKSVVNLPDTVLDIGANIGCTALLLSTMCSMVYAVEPVHTTYDLLTTNIKGRTNIKPFNVGLGNKSVKTTTTYNTNHRSGAWVSDVTPGMDMHATEDIQIEQTDEFIRKIGVPKIDFIKIDAEGYEPHILLGAKDTLQHMKPIVALECNHWCLNALQRVTIPDFFDTLMSLFPVLYAVEKNTRMNLHDKGERFSVMYRHITKFQYMTIVGAFPDSNLSRFMDEYKGGLG